MDYDDQKCESEMEILTMVQQMGRTPQFFGTLSDFTDPPFSDLPGSTHGAKLGGCTPPYFMQGSSSTVSSMNSRRPVEEQHPRKWREGNPARLPREKPGNSVEAMREMIFRIAVMQPIEIDAEVLKAPKRRNVKISKDPQSVAARQRREKISERIRILQRLVPGGTKMDTASMLEEAVHYVKFLKTEVQSLERAEGSRPYGIISDLQVKAKLEKNGERSHERRKLVLPANTGSVLVRFLSSTNSD